MTLQTINKAVVRATLIGVVAQTGSGSEIWAWTEVLPARGSEETAAPADRTTTSVETAVTALHPLASGETLLSHGNSQYSILSKTVAEDGKAQMSVTPLGSVKQNGQVNHYTTLLDPSASKQLFGAQALVPDDLLATIITFHSAGQASASGSAASKATGKDKKGKQRRTAMEVIDDAEGSGSGMTSRSGPSADGPLTVEVTLLLTDQAETRIQAGGKASIRAGGDAANLLDVHFYHDGHLSLLTRAGEIDLLALSLDATYQPTVSPHRSLALRHLSQARFPSKSGALLRLSQSHLLVLLHACSGPNTGRFVALIWDTELDALLVALDWAVPGAPGVPEAEEKKTVTLSRVGGSQVMIQGLLWGQDQTQTSALSALWALPFTIPEGGGSVLRHAMGKAGLTAAWLKSEGASSPNTSGSSETRNASGLSSQQASLLERLRSIAESAAGSDVAAKSAEMDTLFTAWIAEEGARVRHAFEESRLLSEQARADATAAVSEGEGSNSDSEVDDQEAKNEAKAAAQFRDSKVRAPRVELSYALVSQLLAVAIPPVSASKPRPYARKILSYLLDRKAVSCGMIPTTEPSLITRLRTRNEWTQLLTLIRNVSDVSEVELVEVLAVLLDLHRKSATGKADQEPTEVPLLHNYLSQFVSMAVSRPLLRSTFHGRITQAADVKTLLDVCTEWLQERAVEPFEFEPGLDNVASSTKKSSSRRKKLGGKQGVGTVKTPPTSDLIQFAMDLVDVYFPLILNTLSTHRSLQALSKVVASHLTLFDGLSELRAPLEAYSRLESDRLRIEEGLAKSNQSKAKEPKQARKALEGPGAIPRAQTGGGLAMPDLNRSVRLNRFEASAMVGPYTIETLEI